MKTLDKTVQIRTFQSSLFQSEVLICPQIIDPKKTAADETALLADDSLSEKDAMKRLGEFRIRFDVLNARVASTEGKIKAQTADLSVQGENVRRSFAPIVAQLWLARQARVGAILSELFGGPIRLQSGRMELKELTRHTSLMRQLRDVDNRLCHPISDPVQETLALQRSRTWLAEVKDLVRSEPALALKSVPAKRQPIEQSRDLVTA